VALLPLVKGLTPECKPSFGHFFGNAEEVDRGCCLSELGVRFCNKINVSKENVIRWELDQLRYQIAPKQVPFFQALGEISSQQDAKRH